LLSRRRLFEIIFFEAALGGEFERRIGAAAVRDAPLCGEELRESFVLVRQHGYSAH